MKGECRWWLNKQGLMMYRRIIGTRMFGWFLRGRWKVSDFGPSFYSNKKRGTGSKKEALCHLLFASHGLFRWSFCIFPRRLKWMKLCSSSVLSWPWWSLQVAGHTNEAAWKFQSSQISRATWQPKSARWQFYGRERTYDTLKAKLPVDYLNLFLKASGKFACISTHCYAAWQYVHDVYCCSSALFCTRFLKVCSWDIQV